MAHVIGHGQNARETYPERSVATALLFVGADCNIEPVTLPATVGLTTVPRNAAGDPLQVRFPLSQMKAGNTMRVRALLSVEGFDPAAEADLGLFLAVSFDGGATFPANANTLPEFETDASGGIESAQVTLVWGATFLDPMPVFSIAAVPWTGDLVFRLQYTSSDEVAPGTGGAWLEVEELASGSVVQIYPGELIPPIV